MPDVRVHAALTYPYKAKVNLPTLGSLRAIFAFIVIFELQVLRIKYTYVLLERKLCVSSPMLT